MLFRPTLPLGMSSTLLSLTRWSWKTHVTMVGLDDWLTLTVWSGTLTLPANGKSTGGTTLNGKSTTRWMFPLFFFLLLVSVLLLSLLGTISALFSPQSSFTSNHSLSYQCNAEVFPWRIPDRLCGVSLDSWPGCRVEEGRILMWWRGDMKPFLMTFLTNSLRLLYIRIIFVLTYNCLTITF